MTTNHQPEPITMTTNHGRSRVVARHHSFSLSSTALRAYTYDGDGRRISKSVGTPAVVTLFAYDAAGNLAAEYGGSSTDTGTRFLTPDHLGSTRLVTTSTGAVDTTYDYFPFGEEISATYPPTLVAAKQDVKFTGKERDAETGLDYFGFRYLSSAQGRWTSPDQPFADQHPEDPQSWNMYGYVRNNPLAHIDPSGKACAAALGNLGSGFCQRAYEYRDFDSEVQSKTRFFAAASATSQLLANAAVPGVGNVGASLDTQTLLESIGQALEKVNRIAVGLISSGLMSGSGPSLDAQMVQIEQNQVQKTLDTFSRTDPTAYAAAVKQINVLLNGSGGPVLRFLTGLDKQVFATDRAYNQFLSGVRRSLGHAIDFSNQKDREAIGNALVQHIRATGGGCDVTGVKPAECR
jgi:RHS repeat-associated protein